MLAPASATPRCAGLKRSKPRGIPLVAGHGRQRIQPQPLVIVEVFVAEGQAVNPLRHQLPHRVIHINLLASVLETRGQAAGQTQAGVSCHWEMVLLWRPGVPWLAAGLNWDVEFFQPGVFG